MNPSERPPEPQPGNVIEPAGFTPLQADAPEASSGILQPGRIALAAVLITFVAALLFLIGARSLQITVIAETPADVSLSGLSIPFGARYLLLPGDYEVEVEAEGYVPLTTSVHVDDRDSQSVELALQPLPGRLSIESQPAGATVLVDGESVGATPLADLPLPAGVHELMLEAPRYLSLRQTLQITGRDIRQQVKLQLAPAWADVTLSSLPPGAELLVDGEPAGTTPAQTELLQGERQLTLRLPGFASWQRTLQIEAGTQLDLGEIALAPAAGTIAVSSKPGGANVTLNGVFQGQTPLTLNVDPEQEHTLSLSRPGYQRHTETLTLGAADTAERDITLRPQIGEVRFEISPENAVLRIDGREVGAGSRTLSLPAVQQRIEVSLAGHAPQSRRITPRPGLEQVVSISLLTEREAVLARLPMETRTSLGQEMRLFIPAESALPAFTMGASRRDPGRRSNEVLRDVTLKRMFYLATRETTNAQFRLFQADHNSGLVKSRSLNREKQPAVQLSWQQAASFCNWLSRREGLPLFYKEDRGIITGFNPASTGYRLPTEAEWAWAARSKGENLLKFPWGDAFPPTGKVENYADRNSAFVTGRVLNNYDDGFIVSAPVGSFDPNQRGLYDLGGNVAEWVHDVYTIPEPGGAMQTDPLGAQSGDNYVIRGASWSMAKLPELRLSFRDYGQAGRDDVGFRIARYAE